MRVPRNQIADALVNIIKGTNLAFVAGVPTSERFNTVSKHFQSWDSQDTSSWPVAFLVHMDEEITRTGMMYASSRVSIRYRLFCYFLVNSADPTFDQDDLVTNPLLDAIDTAFKPPEGQKFDLGIPGVDQAVIDGRVLIADGTDDGRAVYVVPITVESSGW
ncbi:MAG TPA: hypothetical protein VJW77_02340 [Terriglobia bacterium]|nr:hypothetical protein [Terriglobia bacterium]